MENTNLFYLIEEEKGFSIAKGSVRETFFLNQCSDIIKLYYSDIADFIDNKGRIYEIGGKGKTVDFPPDKYFIIADDIVTGFKDKVPLWLFGFLY